MVRRKHFEYGRPDLYSGVSKSLKRRVQETVLPTHICRRCLPRASTLIRYDNISSQNTSYLFTISCFPMIKAGDIMAPKEKDSVSPTPTTAPKRRGRPPKSSTQENRTQPKRRGRPPKAKAKGDAVAPKRRGRPPKAAATSESPSPKRRGRPPKTKTVTATTKKPGRPAGVTAAERLRIVKAEAKAEITELKQQVKTLKAELKAAAQKEEKLMKLFANKTKAVSRFADKWEKEALAKILSPTKRRRRKKSA